MSLNAEQPQPKAHAGAQLRIQRVLIQYLAEAKLKNPAYSLRALSKKLHLSPAAVSEIMNGKRSISIKIAEKILVQLDADPQLVSEVLGAFRAGAKGQSGGQKAALESFTHVSLEQFKIIADWYHFAILSLFETTPLDQDPGRIARRFGIKKSEVIQAIHRLERLGMLAYDESKGYYLTGTQFQTTDGMPSSAIRLFHFQGLELAKKSLEEDSTEERDFNSMTMAIDPSKLEVARKMIRKFYIDLAGKLEVDPKGEVYMLNVGLFPLSRSENSEKGSAYED